ncbi:hypothetical protein TPHA_0M00720 [Tetrapisispora phaffii CBS 4417]|uniref:Small ribosomal subunit protein uS9m n=1 Tax=Tetrapisispora phaffii (strain ATCC 24235 / CBS 4417 / NBRC 1672 / NRRL Y-8282 / UCD 70-5) TaxID=1071381 RepID=G8C0D2_TETPH|nr:mitochondrial 37S ribosomal protein MRPS9 TPHA_0M00720 [Tetrapisispora phaffii CBS 4417]CCE65647.1 hypothetical protein TPHA_0M00720 [Tetrapisispora phaffii CBS 4417]
MLHSNFKPNRIPLASTLLRMGNLFASIPIRSFSGTKFALENVRYQTVKQSRIVPKLATFYSANPHHENCMNRLEHLLNKYIKYPTQSSLVNGMDKPAWLSFEDYSLIGGGTRLRPIQYRQLISILNRLHHIDQQLSNDEIRTELGHYFKKSGMLVNERKVHVLDEFGRAVAVGKRKSSVAKVYLVRGDGQILVNNRQLNDYFVEIKDRSSILFPLATTSLSGSYNVFATTSGGGPTGQAEAISHAIAKALLIFNPLLKPRLRKAGLITRDYRHVERKKPGKKKARKMPTWVKR